MAKYDPLRDYLRRQRVETLEMTFVEIERKIGCMPPKSANLSKWWESADVGQPSLQALAWTSAGYQAALIAHRDRVLFARIPQAWPPGATRRIGFNPSAA